jgi:hypothetical protein
LYYLIRKLFVFIPQCGIVYVIKVMVNALLLDTFEKKNYENKTPKHTSEIG